MPPCQKTIQGNVKAINILMTSMLVYAGILASIGVSNYPNRDLNARNLKIVYGLLTISHRKANSLNTTIPL